MAKYSYSQSLKIMVIPYLLIGIFWIPLSLLVEVIFKDVLMAQSIVVVITTTFIFFVAFFYENTSIYDPYWQTIPIFLVGYWAWGNHNIVMWFLTISYCIKQNYTYFRFWPGLSYEDYRNEDVRKQYSNPIAFWSIMYLGFQMTPSFMSFFGHLPTFYVMTSQSEPTYILYYFGIIFTFLAVLIELIADYQLFPYRIQKIKGNCEVGLWKYSRHPNYFGECMYWWGLYICAFSYGYYWSFWGALSVQALFSLYSIPNMEEHLLKKRDSYASYQKRVSMFLPWWNNKQISVI